MPAPPKVDRPRPAATITSAAPPAAPPPSPSREPAQLSDYSLVGQDTALAIEKGLAEATWYASPVPKDKMRELLQRRDGPAVRDTLIWFALIIGSGLAASCCGGTLVGGRPLHDLRRALRLDLGLPLARVRPRHGLQDRLDEQHALRNRLVHGHARIHASGAGATPGTTATPSSSAATRKSPCPGRRSLPRCFLRFFGINTTLDYFRHVLLHSTGRITRRGEDVHSGIGIRQSLPAGPHLRG